MGESHAPKAEWFANLPSGPPERNALARLVDADGGRYDAESSYYEAVADPDFVRVETAQRRFRDQYLRRLRRLKQQECAPSQPEQGVPVDRTGDA